MELLHRLIELHFGVQALKKHQLIAANLDLSRVSTLHIHRRFRKLRPQRLVPVLYMSPGPEGQCRDA
jgi:hypothetical protein